MWVASRMWALQAAMGGGLAGACPHTGRAQPCDRAVAVQRAVSQGGHLPWPHSQAVPPQHNRYPPYFVPAYHQPFLSAAALHVCVCVCVCMHVREHVFLCMHVHICTCTIIRACVRHMCMRTSMCVSVCVCVGGGGGNMCESVWGGWHIRSHLCMPGCVCLQQISNDMISLLVQ